MTEKQKEIERTGKREESMTAYAKEQLEQISTTPTAPSSPSSGDKGDAKSKDKRRVRKRKHPVSIEHIRVMIDREPELSNKNPREIALFLTQLLGTPVSESSVRAVRRQLQKKGYYKRRLDERVEAVLASRAVGKKGNNGPDGIPNA